MRHTISVGDGTGDTREGFDLKSVSRVFERHVHRNRQTRGTGRTRHRGGQRYWFGDRLNDVATSVTGVQGDVSNLADLDRLFTEIRAVKGLLQVLFTNVGIAGHAPPGEI